MRVGLNLLCIIPGENGGTQTYAEALMKSFKTSIAALFLRVLPRIVSAQAWAAARIGRLGGAHGVHAPKLDLAGVTQVLVVHLVEIGDVVMLTPFLRELRRLLPDARITLAVKPEVRPLVETCPYVTETVTFEANYRPALRLFILPWQAFWTAWSWRRTRRFDLALVPSWQADNSYASFLACFSGAGCRVGYSETISPRRRRLNRGFDQLYTHTLAWTGLEHEVEHEVRRNLAVLDFLGGTAESEALELWPDAEDEAAARSLLQGWLTLDSPLVALCPTAGHSRLKQWPVEKFVALAERLHKEENARILIVGGPGDTVLGAAIEDALGSGAVRNAVGKTSLRQMAALLKLCHCFVGSDAGPMHIAAAVGVPVVAVFGSSCPHRFGPWGPNHRVISLLLPCSPCGRGHDAERCVRCIFPEPRCLTTLPVAEVYREIRTAIGLA